MSVEVLKIEIPALFSRRSLTQETISSVREEKGEISKLEREKLGKVVEVLNHPALETLIDEGKITLGIIKPRLYESRGLPKDDDEAASALTQEIGEKRIIFQLSLVLTPQQVENFYSPVREKYSQIPSLPDETVWDTIVKMTASGPQTFMLIYDEGGNVIKWWREKMGSTHPKDADPNSLRGRYALEEKLPNNLLHGSESLKEVKREIGVLKKIVTQLHQELSEPKGKLPQEELLRDIGFIGEDETSLSVMRIYDSGMRSESWIYGYKVYLVDKEGNLAVRFLKEKNIISFGGALILEARNCEERMERLQDMGVPIPRYYKRIDASLYSEFIVNDKTEEAFREILYTERGVGKIPLLDQLIKIAFGIDQARYQQRNFLGDVLFDSDRKRFFYIDFGTDLGQPSEEPTQNCLNQLKARFPKHSNYIDSQYREYRLN